MPRGKMAKTLALIDACYAILQEIQPATVRAVCYQLFIRSLITSMDKLSTNRMSRQLVYAREQDIVPWEWVVEEDGGVERPGTWATPETFIPVVLQGYRKDRWAHQSRRVEVWSEKGTIRGTLAPVLAKYGVIFRKMGGYSSATKLHDAAVESLDTSDATAQPLVILYCGDYDPSGMHMSAVDIPARLARYGGQTTLTRVALAREECHPLYSTLPSFPVADKKADPRYKWFVAWYGHVCWEVDALSPVALRDRVAAAIEQYLDWDAWLRCDAVEAAEQRSLAQVLGNWPRVIAMQASK